jgi:hypothetical protein
MNYFIIEKICPLSKIYEHASERKSEEIQVNAHVG